MNVFETYIMPNVPEDSRVHKFLDYVVLRTLLTHHHFGRHAMQMRNVQLTAVKASIVISELSFTYHIPLYLISNEQSKVVLKIKASSKEAPLRKRELERSGY